MRKENSMKKQYEQLTSNYHMVCRLANVIPTYTRLEWKNHIQKNERLKDSISKVNKYNSSVRAAKKMILRK